MCCLSCCQAGDAGTHDYCVDCSANPDCPSGGRSDYYDHTPLTRGRGSGSGSSSSKKEKKEKSSPTKGDAKDKPVDEKSGVSENKK